MRDPESFWSKVMYAVIASGGKQYKVAEGDVIKLEKLDAEPSSTIEFDQVLLVADGDNIKVGDPYVKGVKVSGEVVEQARHKKIEIIKFKRRKQHMKKAGHRQHYTAVKINAIGGGKPAAKRKPAAKKAEEQPKETKQTGEK